jgi:hypothetical protein
VVGTAAAPVAVVLGSGVSPVAAVVVEHATLALSIMILFPFGESILAEGAGVGVSVGVGVGVTGVGVGVTGVGVSVGVVPNVGVDVGVLCFFAVAVAVTPPGPVVAVAVAVVLAHASSTTDVFAYDLLVTISEQTAEKVSSKSVSAPTITRTGVRRARSPRAPIRLREAGSGRSLWPGSTGFFLIQKTPRLARQHQHPTFLPEPHSCLYYSQIYTYVRIGT